MTRRELIAAAASSLAASGLAPTLAADTSATVPAKRYRYGMCDWSMGRIDPSAFDVAKQIGLDGMQISLGFPDDKLKLRRPDVQKAYLDAARANGLQVASTAMGVLNNVPLMSEPIAALWTLDGIEATRAVGVKNLLLAFFGKGELKEQNAEDMRRVTEVIRELAPRAEKAGVVLGLETYLSAEAHLRIMDAAASPAVKVYYDVYNANDAGHDYLREIRFLGKDRICEVHFKEGRDYLGSGKIKWPQVVAALKEIDYAGWIILETTSPGGNVVADTRRNLEYLQGLFEKA